MEQKKDTIRHAELLEELHKTYLQKNAAYGNSFHDTYTELGIMSAVTRISDKYNRLKTLAKEKAKGYNNIDIGDERITDTLLDLANYCVMTVMEMEKEELPDGVEGEDNTPA